ncbi:MAG TPA: VOC family protein [Solirubrobacteraceae bacterium]|jgi:predicted enzyme related to lactoylglutathione lyase|nr:VOC family protein [Solirubrobacteraceae bacterium]
MTPTQDPQSRRPDGLAHGQVVYMQIPALDPIESAEFYGRVLGWTVDPPETGFEAPGLIGQWVTDRPPAADAGLLAWIHVDRLEETLELVSAGLGDVVEPPSADGPVRRLATIRDPAGNLVGLVDHQGGAIADGR